MLSDIKVHVKNEGIIKIMEQPSLTHSLMMSDFNLLFYFLKFSGFYLDRD